MPVIVVGADTPLGLAVTERFLDPRREVRVFVSDPEVASDLRRRGAKVALGDVSDDSHLAGAALHCHSLVFVAQAAVDERERSFAADPATVLAAWARAAEAAGVRRVLWLADVPVPPSAVAETAVIDPNRPDAVEEVYRLDAASSI